MGDGVRIAVVSGGNKGIGLETVVLTARNEKRGLEAVQNITFAGFSPSGVVFHQLEITDPSSVARFADFLKAQSGRLGILNFNSEELKREFDDVDNLTEKRLDELLDMFLEDFKANLVEAHGWPTGGSSSYKVTKAALNAYTRILAKSCDIVISVFFFYFSFLTSRTREVVKSYILMVASKQCSQLVCSCCILEVEIANFYPSFSLLGIISGHIPPVHFFDI